MICQHYQNNICKIASEIACEPVSPDVNACNYCTECEKPHQRNMLTIGIARYKIQHTNPELAAKLFLEMKPLMSVIRTKVKLEGPGTELKKLIDWLPLSNRIKKGCTSCKSLEQRMNKWGPDKCILRKESILRQLKYTAYKLGIPYFETIVSKVLMRAIANSRLKSRVINEKSI